MNSYSFDFSGAANNFFDTDARYQLPDDVFVNVDDALAQSLQALYLKRVKDYKVDIINRGYLRQVRSPSFDVSNRYPTLHVKLPGGTRIIKCDGELDARLIEIYLAYGGNGLLALENAFEDAQKSRETAHTEPWHVVLPFYLFTRNSLILKIRQALIDIERQAAKEILRRLSETARAVATAWEAKLRLSSETVATGRWKKSASLDTPVKEVITVYRFGNRQLADSLYVLLTKTINEKTMLDEQIKRKEYLQELIALEEHGPVRLNLEDSEKTIQQHIAIVEAFYNQLFELEPVVLLAVPLLKKGFLQSDMETIIGETLWPFYGKLDMLAKAIDPERSLVELNFPGLPKDMGNISSKIEGLFPWKYNIEVLCAERAVSEARRHQEYLPLVNVEIFADMIETGKVELGTFTYFVCRRYRLTILEQINEKLKFHQTLETVSAKVASALSLAALIVPPLRIANLLLGLPLVAIQAYSTVQRLASLDEIVNNRLAASNVLNGESISAIADIIASRREYADQLTDSLLKEVGLMIAARKFTDFRLALEIRDYYEDLAQLLDE